jgi:oxygen-independent coproporphyrinogen-3 oxidase
MEEYIGCLSHEIDMRSSILEGYKIKSIYIGGGTPTYLNFKYFKRLLTHLEKYSGNGIEYTCEANPGTLSREKLELMKNHGVNRLSIGLQSWNDNILKRLGRIHNLNELIENYYCAKDIGFKNINVDLMFSIYGQSISDFESTLDNVISIAPQHVSCYSLIIEEGTPFHELMDKGLIREVDEETDREMYYLANQKLREAGYEHYEISNYAKQGFKSRHNINYWKTGEYIGIGAGAHSYIRRCRFYNELRPEKYIENLRDAILPVIGEESLSTKDMMSEFMFMGLRMMEGISSVEFEERFGCSLFDIYKAQIEKVINEGLIQIRGDRLVLTERGIDLSNQVFVEFI